MFHLECGYNWEILQVLIIVTMTNICNHFWKTIFINIETFQSWLKVLS